MSVFSYSSFANSKFTEIPKESFIHSPGLHLLWEFSKLFIIVFITFVTPYSEKIVVNVPSCLRQHTNKNITIVLDFLEAFIWAFFYAGCSSDLWGIPPLKGKSFDFMGRSHLNLMWVFLCLWDIIKQIGCLFPPAKVCFCVRIRLHMWGNSLLSRWWAARVTY